ncbi:MAG: 3-deoxy-8-phosphooctulonate synthase [Bacteroidales bacterium]|nr:3-deoxy-8-phosphooctulonate synthase [Bacteroidales bacterium]HOY38686.1 3-deoxy-8-phosphooctulonate synthase [Bacteroidales bacterium]HQP03779.1 3-deoxy-8-phosphooctulonate synthase [Bacteroidales bacterium]
MTGKVHEIKQSHRDNFFLIAGPCVVESKEVCFTVAESLLKICTKLDIPLIYKASYRKANRSMASSFTGIGDQEALGILQQVKQEFGLAVCTDIHSIDEAEFAAEIADVLQIPAFLCRQTDLLVAAGNTGRTVNIKKGQFLSPEAMKFAAEKVMQTGNRNIMLTERGSSFGYTDLIVDFRGIPVMKSFGFPVVLDATHSLQQPNQISGVTGGRPELIATIARAGIAAGVDGLFIETHPDPAHALSDGANMLHLDRVEKLLESLLRIYQAL